VVPGGGTISGNQLITQVFQYPNRQSRWQNWAIVIGWAAFFHMCHLVILLIMNRGFGKAQVSKGSAAGTGTGTGTGIGTGTGTGGGVGGAAVSVNKANKPATTEENVELEELVKGVEKSVARKVIVTDV